MRKASSILLLMAAQTAAAQPSFRGLGIPQGYSETVANGMSADGLFIVGDGYYTADAKYRGYRWSDGNFTWLGDLPGGGNESFGEAVSAHGFHVAGSSQSTDGMEGFRWYGGQLTGLGDLAGGGFYSQGLGISADGSTLCGRSVADVGGMGKFRATIWIRGGPLVDLGALMENGSSISLGLSFDGAVAAGDSESAQGRQAMRWSSVDGLVGLGDLAGGSFFSVGAAVSGDGSVVIGSSESASGTEAYRLTKATGMVGLGDLAGGFFQSEPLAISADGSVIVGFGHSGAYEAFIWDAQNGMRSLRDVLIALGVTGLAGWDLREATGISGDGLTICGNGINPGGSSEAWVATLALDPLAPQDTDIVSVSATEQLGNGGSTLGSVSNDGGVIAFWSNATNLVAGDTNGKADVFIRNIPAAWTNRVSVTSAGAQANGDSVNSRISGNGQFVVFASDATNLVGGDTNARRDIFIHNRTAKTTMRVSLTSAGAQANGNSDLPQVSADGRYVVFQSDATNLVAGDTNNATDIFLRDRQSGTTIRVSVNSAGQQANGPSYQSHLSDNGQSIVFASDATNLFVGDSNSSTDIFLRNRQNNQTILASTSSGTIGVVPNGDSTGPRISGNARYITYTSLATNLVVGDTNGVSDVFVRDRFNATTTRINLAPNQANAESSAAAISGNGRFILYNSTASNLVKGDTNGVRDVFLHDGWTFRTRRVSVNGMGQQGNAACSGTAISANGRFVVFNTSGGLDPFDNNGKSDVYLGELP